MTVDLRKYKHLQPWEHSVTRHGDGRLNSYTTVMGALFDHSWWRVPIFMVGTQPYVVVRHASQNRRSAP